MPTSTITAERDKDLPTLPTLAVAAVTSMGEEEINNGCTSHHYW
ncbi:MAG: hypothetical protein AB7G75_37260 [Candidatus Binatia bacterium]